MTAAHPPFTIIGAGLAGCLLARLLARRGYRVELFERHPDPRRARVPAGRSINLALAERGRVALAEAGVLEHVEAFALPMRGRMIHDETGRTHLQPYGQTEGELIRSVHRGRLNQCLLDAAEQSGADIHFDRRLESVDFAAARMRFLDADNRDHQHRFEVAVGADGAGSALRGAMDRVSDLGIDEQPLDHGYKELTIPPDSAGEFRMDPEALHIWPRGGFMMIALPNPDGSFTCTLFLDRFQDRFQANSGEPGFDRLATPGRARAFMEQQFPDAVALMPDLERELAENPVGFLGTLYVKRWHLDGRAVLVGDAAHAIVPFHGQGMNAAFEDCVALTRLIDTDRDPHHNPGPAFAAFQDQRKPNADAIAAMALDNYLEMRDRVRDPRFQLQKQLEFELEKRLPGRFIPRYSMVMFHPEIPYHQAMRRGRIQSEILEALSADVRRLADIDLDQAAEYARGKLDAQR